MKKLKLSIYPYGSNVTNKYIDRMVSSIKLAYPQAIITAFPNIKEFFTIKGYDYVWLNWFESLPEKGGILQSLLRRLKLVILKFLRIKIVSTFHNIQQHEKTNNYMARILFWMTFKFSNSIIILSDDSKAKLKDQFGQKVLSKTILIPHPTYDCNPKDIRNNGAKFSILFFGHLRPYKNIEIILELAKIFPNIPFSIAGSPYNQEYVNDLKDQSKQIPNVTLISHYLSTEEIDDLVNSHSILLLPYDIKSSLNSGVVIHAICKRINIIVPAIGTVNQLVHKDEVFSYSYKSRDEHFYQLSRMIDMAKNEYDNNIMRFNQRSETLYNEVISNQSPEILATKIQEVLK